MKEPHISPAGKRQDRILRERVHDPYKFRSKINEPALCPDCGAVYQKGRWQWAEAPAGANSERCQACHRIKDGYPAGEITLGGSFLALHRDEILGLARNLEAEEKGEHPLNRIMDIVDGDGETVIRTTDIHLPRRIGEAIAHAYEGDFEFTYDEEGYFIRVTWRRDE